MGSEGSILQVNDLVVIDNVDDDMHGKQGSYQGTSYVDAYGEERSFIFLSVERKMFCVRPEFVRALKDIA